MSPDEFANILTAAALAHESYPCPETEDFIKSLVTSYFAED